MKLPRAFIIATTLILLSSAGFLIAQGSTTSVATAPVHVPDPTHENESLPDGVLAWNSVLLATNVPADATEARFLFTFTNRTVTPVTVLDVYPSCHCTTIKLPDLPWVVPGGGVGQIPVTVNLDNRPGTIFKEVIFACDKGLKQLLVQINVQPQGFPEITEAERARGIADSKIDRQAVFRNDCATCHVKNGEAKYGKALFDADCAICHEAAHRASFVADLQNLKVPTNIDFWQTWISHGKPGSFMPAFS
ncbi:MAG: DUF1573 domain-containing protein [Limisphaerales bacterium]